jgi:hypothetical protein
MPLPPALPPLPATPLLLLVVPPLANPPNDEFPALAELPPPAELPPDAFVPPEAVIPPADEVPPEAVVPPEPPETERPAVPPFPPKPACPPEPAVPPAPPPIPEFCEPQASKKPAAAATFAVKSFERRRSMVILQKSENGSPTPALMNQGSVART